MVGGPTVPDGQRKRLVATPMPGTHEKAHLGARIDLTGPIEDRGGMKVVRLAVAVAVAVDVGSGSGGRDRAEAPAGIEGGDPSEEGAIRRDGA
jgi:hypothetical protein